MIVRIQFAKRGPVRFIGHRDVARVWERAFRRASLPLAFSEGFSPHPKVSFGLALPVGYESGAEYLDVTFAGEPPDVASRLNAVLPDGISVVAASVIEPGAPSLMSQVEWADYLVSFEDVSRAEIESAVAGLPAAAEFATRRRKGRDVVGDTEDLRPAIAWCEVTAEPVALAVRLATQPRVVRPEEICSLLGVAPRLMCRTAQLCFVDGRLVDPYGAPAGHERRRPPPMREKVSC